MKTNRTVNDIDPDTKQAIKANYSICKNLIEVERAFNIDKRIISEIVKTKNQ